jgi:uncharacterized protein
MPNVPFAALPAPLRVVLTLTLAALAGLGAQAVRLPLPWMVGPLFLIAGLCAAGVPLRALPGGRQMGQWAIGTALGLYFTPVVVAELGHHLGVVIGTALAALLVGGLCAVLTRKLAGVDGPTAFFASLPGGASEMAHLAERWGGAVDRIAAAHALRVLLVVGSVPVVLTLSGVLGSDLYVPLAKTVDSARIPLLVAVGLLGAGTLVVLRVANAWILGPLFGVALCTAQGIALSALPVGVVNAGQLLIGCALGVRFSREFFRSAPRFMAVAALTALLSMTLAAALAGALAWFSSVPLATLVLATAPGGVSEMCITAKVLQLGVPLVTACHVLRVVVLTVGAPYGYRLFARLTRAGG